MHKQYNKAPLFEVTCEIIFAQNEPWDVFFFSDFYEKIKDDFPHKVNTQEVILVAGTINNTNPIFEKRSKLECKNEEGNLMLVFKENFLGITVVPPYTGWSSFKENISQVLDAYKDIVRPVLVDKAVLKYRNKINIGAAHSYENICNSFNTRPNLNHLSINKDNMSATQMVLEFKSSDKKSILNIQQHTLNPDTDYPAPVLFDLGYLCVDAIDLIKEENFEIWLEEANEAVHKAFQDSLTTELKETFN